jgi:hypothetical protein
MIIVCYECWHTIIFIMKLYIRFITLGLFICSWSGAQSPAWLGYDTRSAGISLNLHWMQLNDNYFSPLSYNGPGIELNIVSVRHYGGVRRRHLDIGARADYLWNSYGFNSYFIQPGFSWGMTYLCNGLSGDNAISFIGGGLNATSRIYKFINEEPDHIFWATSYMLEFNYILDFEINNDRKAFLEIKVPLAGLVSRPGLNNHYSYQLPGIDEYLKRLHENIGFATLNSFQSLNFQALVDLSRSRRKSVNIGYELDFTRFTGPSDAVYFTNSLFMKVFLDAFVLGKR